MREIPVRGSDTRVTGALQVGEVPPAVMLVCIHGGGCNRLYFDLGGYSVAAAARRRGFVVLLIDRPGYGASEGPATEYPIDEAAGLLNPFIAQVRRTHGLDELPVALLGHSIGAAVAIRAAGEAADFPLGAVVISGIGKRLLQGASIWFAEMQTGEGSPRPPASFFFGPEKTYDWRGPAALRHCSETWQRSDIIDVMARWPRRFAESAARVHVPVHIRLAENEGIWDTSPAALGEIASAFAAAPTVDAGLLPYGGHLYEVHRRGAELTAEQLDFISSAVLRS